MSKRRQQLGIEALSSGMIALGAGDKAAAMRSAIQARKSLPNEPLTHLLRAQAAQISGDRTTARRIFEAMLAAPDTEQLGLRGLFLEAQRVGETEAARHFAERAVALNPKLNWAVDALFELQCRQEDWAGALETLAVARKNGHVERPAADRRRAVLLAAQAQTAEENEPERALTLALEAHGLAPNLVPPATIAGRLLASRGNTPRAAKILQRTWSRSPHPDLATVYAYARIGDSPRDRLERVKQLAALTPNSIEGPIAVAAAAIEAHQYDDARDALAPLLHGPHDAARRDPHGAHRRRAARRQGPRARMARARRACPARSSVDGRRDRRRPLGRDLAGDGRARCIPVARPRRDDGQGRRDPRCQARGARRARRSADAGSARCGACCGGTWTAKGP